MNVEKAQGIVAKPGLTLAETTVIAAVFICGLQASDAFFALGTIVLASGKHAPAIARQMQQLADAYDVLVRVVLGCVGLYLTRRSLPGSLSAGALAPIGWRATSPIWPSVAFALGCIGCVAFFEFAAVDVSSRDPALFTGWHGLVWILSALVAAPLTEEFFFRGVLFSGLARHWGWVPAGALTSTLFVAMHLFPHRTVDAFTASTLVAIGTLTFRLSSRSLVPPIAFHIGHNLVVAAFGAFAGIG